MLRFGAHSSRQYPQCSGLRGTGFQRRQDGHFCGKHGTLMQLAKLASQRANQNQLALQPAEWKTCPRFLVLFDLKSADFSELVSWKVGAASVRVCIARINVQSTPVGKCFTCRPVLCGCRVCFCTHPPPSLQAKMNEILTLKHWHWWWHCCKASQLSQLVNIGSLFRKLCLNCAKCELCFDSCRSWFLRQLLNWRQKLNGELQLEDLRTQH